MLDDVLVVSQERVARKRLVVPQELELVEEIGDVVFVERFEFRGFERIGQLFEVGHLEERQHPLVQDEFLVKSQRRRFRNQHGG